MRRKRSGSPGLRLTNTLTGQKERFRNREGKRVKLFTCGPSIYKRPHVGNYRTFLFEDLLQRYLAHRGYRVERVINFTDVEDKSIAEAKEKGTTLKELTRPVAERFFNEAASLRIQLPPQIPRSSTSVDQAVTLIKKLLETGHAYRHGADVFYDPLTFPSFGKLFGLDMSRWPEKRIRYRKDTYPGQRWNLGDFILWHGHKEGSPNEFSWDTEIGRGRPAWNIQDPAMIAEHLGFQIDIACGGVDNLYRHHDYTIAVMEAVSGRPFSNFWLHGEHVLVHGAKMSKSKGNIFYLEDLLEPGFDGRHARFFLIYGHYRSRINLTPEAFRTAAMRLDAFLTLVREVTDGDGCPRSAQPQAKEITDGLVGAFEAFMDNDLDVKNAFDRVEWDLRRLRTLKQQGGVGQPDVRRVGRAMEQIDAVFKLIYS